MTTDSVLTQMQQNLINQNPTFAKQIDKIGFERRRNGSVYYLDTWIGGGRIDTGKDLDGKRYYQAIARNAVSNEWKPYYASSLNEAKAYIKSKLKGQ